MQIQHQLQLDMAPSQAWATLTNLEFVASCLPGATLAEHTGDDYLGTFGIKVGAITAKFNGRARFVELDPERHVAVLDAKGDDRSGRSTAHATVRLELAQTGAGTRATVTTDLALSGRLAQFGRGIVGDVSRRLLDEFATNLAAARAVEPADAAGTDEVAAYGHHAADVFDVGSVVLTRNRMLAGVVAAALMVGVLRLWRRSRLSAAMKP